MRILGMTPLTCVAAAIAVLAAIGSGSVQLPLGIPPAYVDVLKSWDNFIVGLWAIVLPFILHQPADKGIPESKAGPSTFPGSTGAAIVVAALAALAIIADGVRQAAAADLPQHRPAPIGHVFSFGPAPGAPPSFAGALQGLLSGGVAKIVADLRSMDSVAGAVDPNSTYPAPDNVWNPYAHACAAPAIAWLNTLPSQGSVPKPAGPGGVLTDIVVLGANLQATQDFVAKLTATGIPPSLHMACDPFVMWIVRSPARIQSTFSADLTNFLTLFQRQ